jgi:6-phosphogluconolactonase
MQSPIHQPPSPPVLLSFKDTDELVDSLAIFVEKAQRDSINKKGRFTVALSGGSLPKMLRGLINNPNIKWDQWSIQIYSSLKSHQLISLIGMFTT